ncbi:hypothetical protein CVT24_012116 [Panaeolus cyanescens]|uniref:Methyltransferase domain-containing protein n=1 Tax=Panaeolus cyanescens TaxID=181874 RepID=A0A409VHG1_9AGAR|nr:hypothetical protein CVT24_012116 [Panaeolus cyanescens]
MAGIWQRHPRYTAFVTLGLMITLYMLYSNTDGPVPASSKVFILQDSTLPSRVQRAHEIYDDMLKQREGLIKKFGPKPKDIELFPENKAPWPPYTVWDFFPAAFTCPHEIQRLGALGDGGKFVCGLSRVVEKPDCVVYSFGINGESSFEREILDKTDYCQIWGYDFSVKSFGPEISRALAHRTHFKAFGLAGSDKDGPRDHPKMYKLETLMKQNGHDFIDILKIDIEGWEFETLTALIKPYIQSRKPLPFGQLQLEIHLWNKSFEYFLGWWEMLEEAGLRAFWTEVNTCHNSNHVSSADCLSNSPTWSTKTTTAMTTCRVFLLMPDSYTVDTKKHRFTMKDDSLASRVERSHWIYDNMLQQRAGLIRKFGPTPQKVQLFPENRRPWPPYTVWDFFPAMFNCPHEMQRLGALGDGGKWVCGLSRVEKKPDCIVYSFGINKESSFERDVLAKTEHCTIYGYDFSVKSFGPEIMSNVSHRTHFKPYGLSGENKHGPSDDPPMYTLPTLLKMNGHKYIDILKVDVESHEFDTLARLIHHYIESGEPLPFGQLQLEIHLWDKTFEHFLRWFEMLEDAGLRPFWTEPNLVFQNYNQYHTPDLAEYSFLNVKGDNVFIKDSSPRGL